MPCVAAENHVRKYGKPSPCKAFALSRAARIRCQADCKGMRMNIWLKYLITAALVVVISEVAKRSDRLGALFSSLPIMTMLVLFWLFFENQPQEKIANHAYYTFWYVVGTLPFFLIFPVLLPKFGFVLSLSASMVFTLVLFLFVLFAGETAWYFPFVRQSEKWGCE